MPAPRRKYNPDRAKQKIKQLQAAKLESQIREALIGATLSWNSTWEEREFYPAGFEKGMKVVGNDADFLCAVSVKWQFEWRVTLTVYAQDKNGKLFDQPAAFTEYASMEELEDFIEGEVLEEAKAACKGKTINNWGYVAEITG